MPDREPLISQNASPFARLGRLVSGFLFEGEGCEMTRYARRTDQAELFYNYWTMLVGSRLPVPEYRFDAELGRKHRFDWAWVEDKIAVEVDGGQFAKFGGRHSTDADREKLNIAASLGWRVFRFSPR